MVCLEKSLNHSYFAFYPKKKVDKSETTAAELNTKHTETESKISVSSLKYIFIPQLSQKFFACGS